MARMSDLPPLFKAGADQISAEALNKIVRALPREISGAGETEVEHFGDRILIRTAKAETLLPDITNYLSWFVVLGEFDDYLLCAKYEVDVDTNDIWEPYAYDATRGAMSDSLVHVAKPHELQKVAWDGKYVTINAVLYQYTFTGLGTRDVLDAGTVVRSESIQRQYVPGDIILGVRKVTGLRFTDPTPGTTLTDPVEVGWMDVNQAGRKWTNTALDGKGGYCSNGLAKLQDQDAVIADGPSNSVMLVNHGGVWVSADSLTYSGGSGIVRLWVDKGAFHSSLGVPGSGPPKELLGCSTGCFQGGPATGHYNAGIGFVSCLGQTFLVCFRCTTLYVNSVCYPGPVPAVVYATITGSSGFDGVYPLTYYSTPGNSGWGGPIPGGWGCTTPGGENCFIGLACISGAWVIAVGGAPISKWSGTDPSVGAVTYDPVAPSWTAATTAFNGTLIGGCTNPCNSSTNYTIAVTFTNPGGGGGGAGADCSVGRCGDVDVSTTLTGTFSSTVGTFAGAPTITFDCVNDPTNTTNHYWLLTGSPSFGGHTQGSAIRYINPNLLIGWTTAAGAGTATNAQAGYTCHPFAAIFNLDDGAGNTAVLTVTG